MIVSEERRGAVTVRVAVPVVPAALAVMIVSMLVATGVVRIG